MRMLIALLLFTVAGPPGLAQTEAVKYQFSERKMGTTFNLAFYAQSPDKAKLAAQKAFQRIEQLEMIFSDYREQSEISRLAASAGTGKKVKVSDELWELLVLSRKISKASDGAFDITVGPLSKLWRRAFRQNAFPEAESIAAARSLVNFRWVKLYPSTRQVSLQKVGMQLDFGGIAKGYAVDEAFRILQDHGYTEAMVEGGGDLFVGNHPKSDKEWQIALMDQNTKMVLTNQALAASGDTYRHLIWKGKKYSHIIDPRTGYGLTNSSVVYVVADNCTEADALASAASLLTGKKTGKLLKKFDARLLE